MRYGLKTRGTLQPNRTIETQGIRNVLSRLQRMFDFVVLMGETEQDEIAGEPPALRIP